jgi:hypothetical protein
MSIPPGSLVTEIDFLDPACFTNGGTSVTDLSGNSNDWTLNNTSYTYNSALGTLDFGTTCVMTCENQTPVGTGDVPFTISLWHYATGKRDGAIIYNGNYPASGINLQTIFSSGNTKYVVAYGPNLAVSIESANTFINSWNFITISYDGTTLKLYVNGSVVDSVATTLSQGVSGSYPNWSANNENTGVEGFGLLNIYDAALTAGDILTLYNNTKSRFAIVASYDLNNLTSYPGTGTTVYDLSGNGKNLTLSNTTYYDGASYNSLVFNAASPSIANYNGSLGVPTSPPVFTFFMWIKTTSFNASTDVFFCYGKDGNPSIGGIPLLISRLGGNNVAYTEFGSGKAAIAPGTPTVLNEWTNYCITSDGTTYKLYIDGSLVGSAALSGSEINTPEKLTIGNFDGGGFPCNLEFNLLNVYDSAVSAGDITTLYNNTVTRFTPPPPTLIGSYDFSDPLCYPGTGETAFDLTANNNDLVMNGSGAQPSYGGTGQSKYFSFLNDNINNLYCSQFSALGTTFGGSSFTLSAWHNYDNTQQDNAAILFGGNGQNNDGVTIQVTGNDGNKIYGGIFGTSAAVGIANTANTWHMSTLTGDGTTLKIYQDGALIGSTSQVGSWNGRGFVLGRYLNASYNPVGTGNQFRYAGLIGIAEVYSGALGSTDISDLYDLQQPRFIPAPPPPPVPATLKYDFSDPLCYPGSGSTVFDLTANNIDGAITAAGATYVGSGTSSYFQFNGTSNNLISASVPTTGFSGFTFNLWVMPENASVENVLMSFGNNGTGTIPFIDYSLFTPSKFLISNGFGVGTVESSIVSPINVWVMVTYSYTPTTCKIYIDGVLAGTVSGTVSVADPSPYRLGSYGPGTDAANFYGRIAIAEVYNTGLGSTDITNLYNNEESRFFPAPPPPPVGILGGRQFAQGFNG